MGVGAVNEEEDNSIHSTLAVIFFVASEIYIILLAVRDRQLRNSGGKGIITNGAWIFKAAMG
jgi:hypothetical protein